MTTDIKEFRIRLKVPRGTEPDVSVVEDDGPMTDEEYRAEWHRKRRARLRKMDRNAALEGRYDIGSL